MLWQFKRTSKTAVARNRKTLLRILRHNADSEFGRQHRFDQLADDPTAEAYRRAVPLSAYPDYRDAITRMELGETGILTSDEVLFFALSSGTTGAAKLVPTTKRHHGFTFRYMGTVVQGVIASELHRGRTDRGIDLMSFTGQQQLSPGGVPIGSATAEAVRRMARITPHLWNSPIEIYTLEHLPSARYIHALYGLRNRDNQFVEAVFAPRLLEWTREVVDRWDELVADVRNGTLSDDLEIDDQVRQQVLADTPADPARAAELEAAAKDGFAGFLPRVWPAMTHLMTISTGSFALYVPALREYVGDLPIYSPSYGATESFIGVNLWPDRPGRYVMATDPSYFEFIPIAPSAPDGVGHDLEDAPDLIGGLAPGRGKTGPGGARRGRTVCWRPAHADEEAEVAAQAGYASMTAGVTRSGVVSSKKRHSIREFDSTVRFEPVWRAGIQTTSRRPARADQSTRP